MSIFIKAGLWTSKKLGYKGELNLDLFVENKIATTPATLPYKVYTALMIQTGSPTAPTPTIFENTLGDIVWSYDSVGLFTGTLIGAFKTNKTVVFITTYGVGSSNTGGNYKSMVTNLSNQNTIQYNTSNTDFGISDTNGVNVAIEIRVYN